MNMRSTISFRIGVFSLALTGGGAIALAVPAGHAAARPAHSMQAMPAALRPVVYRTLAKNEGLAYAVNEKGCATLPGRKLAACFNEGGVHFSGGGSLALHLVAFGRGATLAPVQRVKPVIRANRVSYDHSNLTEWWRVLPIGFEQGFVIAKRPIGDGELTLALTVNNQATQQKDALGWGKLRYGQLVVTDAKGRAIPATLKARGDRVLIAVNDAHAVYPLTVDPLVWLGQIVSASDGAEYDSFGDTVALDGTTALVGAPCATYLPDTGCGPGAVYVFTESNGTWTQTQKLTASDGAANDGFGSSVALDGTTAVIGAYCAPYDPTTYECGAGAAYVFTDSNGTWTQTAKLTANNGTAGDGFGASIALDDTTALIGAYCAPYDPDTGECGSGAAYAFSNSGGTWSQAQELTASGGMAEDYFGSAIAVDGATALIGAPGPVDNSPGAAYVFSNSDGTWIQTQELTASDGAGGAQFGNAVALGGSTALVGAPNDFGSPELEAATYVFSESGGIWTQIQKLTAGGLDDNFGHSVALSGATALVGAPFGGGGGSSVGAAYVFIESSGVWSQAAVLTWQIKSHSTTYEIGSSVALDGTTALVGAPAAPVKGHQGQGRAAFFGERDMSLAVSAPQSVGQGQQYTSQTIATNNASAASPAVTATITVPAAASFISATASRGSCSETSGIVTCDFGQISGNANTATANVTLKAVGSPGTTIDNTASIALAEPALTASAPTTITGNANCPAGYTEYDGNLAAHQQVQIVSYQAPAGEGNAILTAPAGFQLYVRTTIGGHQQLHRIPGNEIHRHAPAGTYTWGAKAGAIGGTYTLCILHP